MLGILGFFHYKTLLGYAIMLFAMFLISAIVMTIRGDWDDLIKDKKVVGPSCERDVTQWVQNCEP
jgi:hypothetical protein